MTTLQAILLYLAVGYFVDRCLMELDGSWLTLSDEREVMILRYVFQFAWPIVPPAICFFGLFGLLYVGSRACWTVLRPTKQRADARPSEADEGR